MQLSVEVNSCRDASVLVCRGKIVQGPESDYLFGLVTRPDQRDVILDIEGVASVDDAGLFVILLCYEYLVSNDRRLFLRNPSIEVLDGLRRRQAEAIATLPGGSRIAPPAAWRQAVQ